MNVKTALFLPSWLMLLSACASAPPIVKTEFQDRLVPVAEYPPTAYTDATPEPAPAHGITWGQTWTDYVPDLRAALQQCNVDKRNIVLWVTEQRK